MRQSRRNKRWVGCKRRRRKCIRLVWMWPSRIEANWAVDSRLAIRRQVDSAAAVTLTLVPSTTIRITIILSRRRRREEEKKRRRREEKEGRRRKRKRKRVGERGGGKSQAAASFLDGDRKIDQLCRRSACVLVFCATTEGETVAGGCAISIRSRAEKSQKARSLRKRVAESGRCA